MLKNSTSTFLRRHSINLMINLEQKPVLSLDVTGPIAYI